MVFPFLTIPIREGGCAEICGIVRPPQQIILKLGGNGKQVVYNEGYCSEPNPVNCWCRIRVRITG